MHFGIRLTALFSLVLLGALPRVRAADALEVCATIPDLASLAKSVGGELVKVKVLAKGAEDPHSLEPRPSFIRTLYRADVFLRVGLDLEQAWVDPLLRNARNAKVVVGAAGHIDASSAIRPLRLQRGALDRSAGDVHARGNPHYLLDPLQGLRVARLIAKRFTALRPESRETFSKGLARFERELTERLLGKSLLAKHPEKDWRKLLELLERGGLTKFLAFLDSQGQRELLGGWLGALAPYRGAKLLADHSLWPYFARRFGLEIANFLEPRPGLAPTTRHLAELIKKHRTENYRALLATPYFNSRHAEFLKRKTGIPIVPMAHQAEARKGTKSYFDFIDHNVRELEKALARSKPTSS